MGKVVTTIMKTEAVGALENRAKSTYDLPTTTQTLCKQPAQRNQTVAITSSVLLDCIPGPVSDPIFPFDPKYSSR